MAKAKTIMQAGTATVEPLCTALQAKFPQFQFKPAGEAVTAEGPWELKANERPAMGTMSAYGDGYLQCLIDRQ